MTATAEAPKPTLSDEIRRIQRETSEAAQRDYWDRAAKQANDIDVDPEAMIAAMEKAGKSIADLQSDVAELRERSGYVARFAQLPGLEIEVAKVVTEIQGVAAERDAAIREAATKLERLNARRTGYMLEIERCRGAKQWLIVHPRQEVTKRQRELNERRAPLLERFRRHRQGLLNLSAADSEAIHDELEKLNQEQAAIDADKLTA